MERYIVTSEQLHQQQTSVSLTVGLELFNYMENSDFNRVEGALMLYIDKVNQNRVRIVVDGMVSVQGPCDRCLELMYTSFDLRSEMFINFGSPAVEFDGEEATIGHGEDFNVAQFVYDSIMVTMPTVRMHPRGFCNPAMEALITFEEDFDTEGDDEEMEDEN